MMTTTMPEASAAAPTRYALAKPRKCATSTLTSTPPGPNEEQHSTRPQPYEQLLMRWLVGGMMRGRR